MWIGNQTAPYLILLCSLGACGEVTIPASVEITHYLQPGYCMYALQIELMVGQGYPAVHGPQT